MALLLLGINTSTQISYAKNENIPAIITQVELDSPFETYQDNQTCTSPPIPGFANNCLTNLVPNHKVQCSYFMGSNTCEPIRQYTTGTNQSCFNDSDNSSGPQWFDVYNTLNETVDLQNFTVLERHNDISYGQIGPHTTIMEMKPGEKCTFSFVPADESMTTDLNNMSMEITYHYKGKDYNMTTPSLSDTNYDTKTWQLDENKWTFAEQNTVTVPEFPFAILILLISITSLIIFHRINVMK
jgi:hypothetical protein